MFIRKRSGPTIEPWGTPVSIVSSTLSLESMVTNCCLSVKEIQVSRQRTGGQKSHKKENTIYST